MPIANGIHHLALSTNDMKGQIQFFSEVCGMELMGLFWMHGAHGAFHCFLKLNDQSYMSFVQTPDMGEKKAVAGVSYASHMIAGAAPGAMQHVAFNVGTDAELFAMRNRIRKAGYQVMGSIDHGISKSIYLNAPENILMEFTSAEHGSELNAEMWVDPECARLCGFSEEELARCLNPAAIELNGEAVPNPKHPRIPFDALPDAMRDTVLSLTDEELGAKMNYTQAPNAKQNA